MVAALTALTKLRAKIDGIDENTDVKEQITHNHEFHRIITQTADNDYLASGNLAGSVTIWKIGPLASLVGAEPRHSKVLPLA